LGNVNTDQLIPRRRINRSDSNPKVSYKDILKTAGLASTLKEYYFDDINELSTATGRDLSVWMDW